MKRSLASPSLRSKRFRGVWEQRNTEERDFRHFSRCNSLLPNSTETLATQAKRARILGLSVGISSNVSEEYWEYYYYYFLFSVFLS